MAVDRISARVCVEWVTRELGLRLLGFGRGQWNYRYHLCPGTCDERILMWDSEFPRNPQKYLESVNIHSVQTTALPSLPGVQEP